MGIDLVYFVASDDAKAAAVENAGWPVNVAGQIEARGYDPMVTLGTLEEILTGQDFDSVIDDPRSGGTPEGSTNDSDADFVITVTDGLRDALAAADDTQLGSAAQQWAETEELSQGDWHDSTVADHLSFIRQLQALARQAVSEGSHLYCFASM